MLPPSLRESYQQYKLETGLVAVWLLESARLCGYEPARAASKKSKGKKAKKAAGEAEQISIADFTTLAEFLATHSVAKLTQGSFAAFGEVLGRVIAAREEHNSWFRDRFVAEDQEQHKHSHFVGVLREVQALLGPDVAARATPGEDTFFRDGLRKPVESSFVAEAACRADSAGDASHEKLPDDGKNKGRQAIPPMSRINIFESLSLEDVEEEASAAASSQVKPALPAVLKEEQSHPSLAMPTDLEEALFAARCVIKDADYMRQYLFEISTLLIKHDWSLSPVSTLCDVAVSEIERVERSFNDNFRSHKLSECVHLIYQKKCQDLELSSETSAERPYPFDTFPEITELNIPARRILESLKGVENLWTRKSDYDLITHSLASAGQNYYEEDGPELYNRKLKHVEGISADLAFLSKHRTDFAHIDHLVKFFGELGQKKDISFAATFALQLYLDTKRVMGDFAMRGHEILDMIADKAANNINKTLDHYSKTPKDRNRLSQEFSSCNNLLSNYIKEDPVKKERQKRSQMRRGTPDFHLYDNHPLLCGNIVAKLMPTFNKQSVEWCNRTKNVLKMAHLYNACRAEGYLEWQWEDMESVITTFKPAHLFVGNRPGKGDDYWSRYYLATGTSPATYEAICPCTKPKSASRRTRPARQMKLEETRPILTMLMKKFDGDERAGSAAIAELDRRIQAELKYGTGPLPEEWQKIVHCSLSRPHPNWPEEGGGIPFLLWLLSGFIISEVSSFDVDYLALASIALRNNRENHADTTCYRIVSAQGYSTDCTLGFANSSVKTKTSPCCICLSGIWNHPAW